MAAAAFEAEREGLEAQLAELQQQMDGLRAQRETLQQAAAEASAALAGLEERRRNAAANFEQTNRVVAGHSVRVAQIEQQMEASAADEAIRASETFTGGRPADRSGERVAGAHDGVGCEAAQPEA